MKMKQSQDIEEELISVRKEKSQLEKQLMELSNSPFYQNFKDETSRKIQKDTMEKELINIRKDYDNILLKVKSVNTELEIQKNTNSEL